MLIEKRLVSEVRKLFDDGVKKIRNNAYVCLIKLADFTYGVDNVITFDIIPILVENLVIEKDEDIMILILTLLRVLSDGEAAPMILLGTPVLARLNKHLSSKNSKIRELAASNLASISFNMKGKEQTIESGSIPHLCQMLHDEVSEVRTAATQALASLT